MCALYGQLYANGGIVAYGRSNGPFDHLFVWAAPNGPAAFADLNSLLAAWSAAPAVGGVTQRSVFFCQSFKTSTLAAAFANLMPGDLQNCWNKAAYWIDPVFAGGAAPFPFPSKNPQVIQVGDLSIYLPVAAPPQNLDDFTIVAAPSDSGLQLGLKSAPGADWVVDNVTSPKDAHGNTFIYLMLDIAGFAAGAVSVTVPWAANSVSKHPMQRTQFMYAAPPQTPPGPRGAACRAWSAQFADVVTGSGCQVRLDPRDSRGTSTWFNGDLNSHLQFDDAVVQSTMSSARGDRFALTAPTGSGATARLGFVYDWAKPDGSVQSIAGKVMFHPEGSFAIQAPSAGGVTALNVSARDLVAGSASTEFFDTTNASVLHFVKRMPAYLIEGETGDAMGKTLLGPQVYTSYVQFDPAINPAHFHSQPAEAPLFESPAGGGTQPLGRRRLPFGPCSDPLPIFPFVGCAAGQPNDDILRFDSTHLALKRRNLVQAASLVLRGRREHGSAAGSRVTRPPTTRAVTPQGLLADVDADGNYLQLYFGNPDGQTAEVDFSLTLTDPGAGTLFQELQHALAGNQLFIVLRNNFAADSVVPSVIGIAAAMYLNDFQFSIGAEAGGLAAGAAAPPDTARTGYMSASALIIKFHTGKSLASLLADTSLWVCQEQLAPSGNSDLNDWNPLLKLDATDPLQAIWTDKNWQGVLAIDFAVAVQPDVLEALRPGLFSAPKTNPVLRANYFGLNAVPIRLTDVASSTPPTRFCSAFGLIKYDKGGDPNPPTSTDATPGQGPTNSAYTFTVEMLNIAFDKSQISSFAATVIVGFTHMFWDVIDPNNPSTITLIGGYERRPQSGGGTQDVFSLTADGNFLYTFQSGYIDTLSITRAQLTASPATGGTLNASLLFDGSITFNQLKVLDLFSVQSINLSSFGFTFQYTSSPWSYAMQWKKGGISGVIDFDPATIGGNLIHSVLSMLPVTLKGMTFAVDNLIDISKDLQFTPVGFGGVGQFIHFGFLMEVDLGSLGELAGSLSSFRLPMLVGWRAAGPGLPAGAPAFGIQFPTFKGSINIGLQQFISLQAQSLVLQPCFDATGSISALAIALQSAQIVMFNESWSEQPVGVLFFVPISSGRKVSWALALGDANSKWYVGGGYRINLDGSVAKDTKDIATAFMKAIQGPSDPCILLGKLQPSSGDNWSVVGHYAGDSAYSVTVAVADPGMYGVDVSIADFDLDLLYQRVNDQLGIFSIELQLPLAARTYQFGAATVRLPVVRMELHTDGGYLLDLGFPWDNDYSRAAQVEVYIFVGSGGFYYGDTALAADPRLIYPGGHGFLPLNSATSPADEAILAPIRDVRVGYASRGGIGRSFNCGILTAEASLTLFGSLEGSSAFINRNTNPHTSLLDPLVFAISGTMGLMLDIQISVDFSIIQASSHIVAYVDFGISFARMLAKQPDGAGGYNYFRVTLPVTIYTEVSLSVTLDVRIGIGCVHITIHLHFSTSWRVQFTLGGLGHVSYSMPSSAMTAALEGDVQSSALATPALPLSCAQTPVKIDWTAPFNYWGRPQSISLYVTVLGCLADATMNPAGDITAQPGVVGTMLLPVLDPVSGLGDLARFLAGWALLQDQPPSGDPTTYDTLQINLCHVLRVQDMLSPGPNPYIATAGSSQRPTQSDVWLGFPDALLAAVSKQFVPQLKSLTLNPGAADAVPYAVVPLWPGCSFRSAPIGLPTVSVAPAKVIELGSPLTADQAVFVEYCRHLMVELVVEIRHLIEPTGTNQDPTQVKMLWGDIWSKLFQAPQD